MEVFVFQFGNHVHLAIVMTCPMTPFEIDIRSPRSSGFENSNHIVNYKRVQHTRSHNSFDYMYVYSQFQWLTITIAGATESRVSQSNLINFIACINYTISIRVQYVTVDNQLWDLTMTSCISALCIFYFRIGGQASGRAGSCKKYQYEAQHTHTHKICGFA